MPACRALRASANARRGRLQEDTNWSSMRISELEHHDVPLSWPSLSSKHGRRATTLRAGVTAQRWMCRTGLLHHGRTVVNSRRRPPHQHRSRRVHEDGAGCTSGGRWRRMIADAAREKQLKLSKSELNWEEEWSFGEDSSYIYIYI